MSDEKKTPLEELLKSLEGHVVESVEIKGEHIRICEGNEGDILHVRISASELDPKYPEHIRLASKDLSFRILEADFLSRILGWVASRVQDNTQLMKERSATKKEISVTKDLTFSLTDIRKLLDHIKRTITETFRIRKPVED